MFVHAGCDWCILIDFSIFPFCAVGSKCIKSSLTSDFCEITVNTCRIVELMTNNVASFTRKIIVLFNNVNHMQMPIND